jgi:hypothetical protein
MDRKNATPLLRRARSTFSQTWRTGSVRSQFLCATAALGTSSVVEAHSGSAHVHGELLAATFLAALAVLGAAGILRARRRSAALRRRIED